MRNLGWLLSVLEGDQLDQAAALHLVAGLRVWLRSGTRGRTRPDGRRHRGRPLPLAACLGLHVNPQRARLQMRDVLLKDAARQIELDAKTPLGRWQLQRAMQEAAHRFETHKWPCWWQLDRAPGHATPVERLLHAARRVSGERLPTSARRYGQILGL